MPEAAVRHAPFDAGGAAVARWGRIALLALALGPVAATAQPAPTKAKILRCGNEISDRSIVECRNKDQIELNRDGSARGAVRPPMTEEEREADDARVREEEAKRRERELRIRNDVNLRKAYPDEAAHAKAREKGLGDARASLRIADDNIARLKADRKPLLDEAEFYVGKPMPTKLKNALDQNDASLAAQVALKQNQDREIVRINGRYDAELARLRMLWAGSPPGFVQESARPATPPR